MATQINEIHIAPLAAAPVEAARPALRQGRNLLFVIAIEAATLYLTGGILGILLGLTASILFSQLRRFGR
ncbi:hypothetical protein [Paludibaculum fermentans]|uniref:Uncharacterized protein n=1 Tax=Paludibaculum fermentans TaxID=1473598 RepID=A0A7S7NS26_PALFE|nr:hypothetical protein [Paludibaculum fermentans]QOY88802.1 hypothetical protein IRI77_02240 [Paludibaculum fermentans]